MLSSELIELADAVIRVTRPVGTLQTNEATVFVPYSPSARSVFFEQYLRPSMREALSAMRGPKVVIQEVVISYRQFGLDLQIKLRGTDAT